MVSTLLLSVGIILSLTVMPAYALEVEMTSQHISFFSFGSFIESIVKTAEKIAFHVKYVDELSTVNRYVEQFQQWNRNYFQKAVMPTIPEIENFESKLHQLRIVNDNCSSQIIVSDMIKSPDPVEKLGQFCTFPEGFEESLAEKILRENSDP